MRNNLSKKERLHSKKKIESVFKDGKSFFIYPIKIIYLKVADDENFGAEILITVPKRNIKSAVKRNLIKRHIRESYRITKHKLNDELIRSGRKMNIAFIFLGKIDYDFKSLKNVISKALALVLKSL